MKLHFSVEEFADRRARTIDEMVGRGLDGLLMFRQESMYYLTGYDTFGYCFFQCLYLGADGALTLLTRLPDLRQAQHTSVIEDIRVWTNLADANPALALRDVLESHGCRGKRLGIEWEAYGLTAFNGRLVDAALDGFCTLEDASDLVTVLRAVKSPAELEFVRRAADLADAALEEANRLAAPGAFEGDILAAMQGAVFRGDGDYPGNEFIIGSGPDAVLYRYHAARRRLDADDQLAIEFAGVFRHYHACLIRTIRIGPPSRRQLHMHKAALEALEATKEALRPGRPVGEAFDAYARVMDAAGYRDHRYSATGYGLGATFSPTWMDWPMLYHGNPALVQPNTVFFLHMIICDSDSGLTMAPGETVVVTADGCERLSKASLELVVK